MQGYRADLLIADDIESQKNSQTQTMREQLRLLTKDFTSINQSGQILYLGTPQTVDSIYNDLPARGFKLRIWPGRFPTDEEELNYGKNLAPFITSRMKKDPTLRTGGGIAGDRGQPTDPGMMSEVALCKKELDQGKAYFNLQFMLDTALSDADRFPLRLKDLLFYSFDKQDAPDKYTWSNDPQFILDRAVGSPITDKLFRAARVSDTYLPYTHKLLAVDPAGGGQNGDETGLAVVYVVNGYFVVMKVTGIPGGTEPGKLLQIVDLCRAWDVTNILVEKNYGNGAYANALAATLREQDYPASIEEVYNTGQKELRIIQSLEPVIGSHRLIINAGIPEHDVSSTNKYSVDIRPVYQFLFQMKFLTRERNALIHDDRLEAVAMAVRHLTHILKQQQKAGEVPARPVNRFKGFQLDQNGLWKFAHRVQAPHAFGLNVNVRQKFKR
jgi:hypothetical protein